MGQKRLPLELLELGRLLQEHQVLMIAARVALVTRTRTKISLQLFNHQLQKVLARALRIHQTYLHSHQHPLQVLIQLHLQEAREVGFLDLHLPRQAKAVICQLFKILLQHLRQEDQVLLNSLAMQSLSTMIKTSILGTTHTSLSL